MAETTAQKNPFATLPATMIAPLTAMFEEMDRQAERWAEYGQAQLVESAKAARALRRQSFEAAKAMLEAAGLAAASMMETAAAATKQAGGAA